MEPGHFNWLQACSALVLSRHERDKAELQWAKHAADTNLKAAYVAAWQRHHAAENDEFLARLLLE